MSSCTNKLRHITDVNEWSKGREERWKGSEKEERTKKVSERVEVSRGR